MSQITRSWLSFAAIGSGTVHLALVISSPLVLGLPLLLLGLAELVWAVVTLVKGRLVVPRLAQYGAMTPVILWSVLVVTAALLGAPSIASPLRFLPMMIATIFELFIATVLGVQLRRPVDGAAASARRSAPGETGTASVAAAPSAGKYLTAIFVGGLIVGALTTPALAATQAGTIAVEHGGTMSGMMMNMPGMGH